jgi:hypothetical protein
MSQIIHGILKRGNYSLRGFLNWDMVYYFMASEAVLNTNLHNGLWLGCYVYISSLMRLVVIVQVANG